MRLQRLLAAAPPDLPVGQILPRPVEVGGSFYVLKLEGRFPDKLRYGVLYDVTPFIRESVREVFNTLRDAIILVAIVVLLFLQDWKAVMLPLIDVVVSLVGTFAVMKLMGFSLNTLLVTNEVSGAAKFYRLRGP